eukprot:6149157-Alexandrium_andersonii.AAC.1
MTPGFALSSPLSPGWARTWEGRAWRVLKVGRLASTSLSELLQSSLLEPNRACLEQAGSGPDISE